LSHKPKPQPKKSTPAVKRQPTASDLPVSKKIAFTVTFCFLILFLLGMVELVLRLAGYGIDTRVFVQPKYLPEIYVENLYFPNKYWPRQCRVKPNNTKDMMSRNVFLAVKPKNTLRGFMIGESSAQGFPYESSQSFSKITELALKQGGKYDRIELLNLGVSAMTSYFIKDVALKVQNYQPDFIVIYGGHNEYYGTISQTTGGNEFTKNLYLLLKESKLFQLIFDLTDSRPQSQADKVTLMSILFNQKKVPQNEQTDRNVADTFIKNLDTVIRAYGSKKIPVLVVEPVCNLYDMPPFSGEKDDTYQDFITAYYNLVKQNDRRRLEKFYHSRMQHPEYNRNANIRYLDALTRNILDGKPDLASFIAAKDLDSTPFRARSELVKDLGEYCRSKAGVYSKLYYLPLFDVLKQEYGEKIFGNQIFIDQLHFNQRGQRAVSKAIATQLMEIYQFTAAQQAQVNHFYDSDPAIDKAIYYLPAYQISVAIKLKNLFNNLPFTNMLIPYKFDERNAFVPTNDPDREFETFLTDFINKYNKYEINSTLIGNYYLQRGNRETCRNYIDSGVFVLPGSSFPYIGRARLAKVQNNVDLARHDYVTAYLLTEKADYIFKEMNEYFTGINRKDIIDTLISKYGQPRHFEMEDN
jgi:lysophospholipase L1-like esterase